MKDVHRQTEEADYKTIYNVTFLKDSKFIQKVVCVCVCMQEGGKKGGRKRGRERGRERFYWFNPKMVARLGLGQVKTNKQKLHPGLPCVR